MGGAWGFYGRRGGRVTVLKEIGTPQKRPTGSSNLDLGLPSESEPPAKECTRAVPRPSHSDVVDVQLDLHEGPEQLEQGRSQNLLPVCSTSWTAVSGLSGPGST